MRQWGSGTFCRLFVSCRGAATVGQESGFLAAPGLFGGRVARICLCQGHVEYVFQLDSGVR